MAVGIQLCSLSLQRACKLCLCPFSSRVRKPQRVFFTMVVDLRNTRPVSVSFFLVLVLVSLEYREEGMRRVEGKRRFLSKMTKPKPNRGTHHKAYFSYKDRKKREINSCNFLKKLSDSLTLAGL